MSSEYSRSILKVVVASICQTVGWHSINSTPLEFMVDLLQEYLLRISKLTHQYSEILGRTEPNLNDLGLAFRYMNIDVQELIEYVKNVDSVPCPIQVPQYPIRRENHLNFLKPGSREVVTRPVYVHEHLPAMYPDTEEEYIAEKSESLTNGTADLTPSSGTSSSNSNNTSPHRLSPQGIFKRPGDPISFESPIVKRAKIVEEGRPLREISSVMMTTSGFLSPAREGKLPEARTPHQVRAESPQPSSYPMVPPELKCDKKPKKIVKKNPEDRKLDKENKKKKGAKELFKPDKVDDSKIKKLVGMKELAKLKPLKPGGGKTQSAALPQELSGSKPEPVPKIASPKSAGSPKPSKAAQPKVKVAEKVIDLTDSLPSIEKKEDAVDKLPSEPDKQKLNIFKKISKPREEKDKDKDKETVEPPHKYKDLDSRERSPALIIDEINTEKQHVAHRNDVMDLKRSEEKKTPHTPDVHVQATDGPDLVDVQSPPSDVYMFDDTDISPPGTPSSTPKTPELNVPIVVEQKRKKKEKSSKKKEPKLKSPKQCISPKKMKIPNDIVETDLLDRPKTPQALEPQPLHRETNLPPTLPFPFFPAFPPTPGLIPPPMFQRFPLPLPRGGPGLHPAMPNLAIPPRFPNPPLKPEDFPLSKIKPMEREKLLIQPPPVELVSALILGETEKADKEKVDNNKITKMFKPSKELSFMKVPERVIAPPIVSAPIAPPIMLSTPTVPVAQMLPSKNPKAERAEKNDTINSKSKEHKKEKKDKLKKKKDKKEKHKDKGEKVKEKKEKAEKREKLEKLKDKKEKKEKKKEKDANKKNTKEDKNPEAVPKITLKLGTASPRPATPDNAPMKKITIKPLLKKPDEEIKREPSPELAKISALVTRPPKQKSTSKKTEEGLLDGSPALPTDSFSANLTSVPPASAPRKKSIYQSEPLPTPHFDPAPKLPNPLAMPQQLPYYFDRGGRQVWICPACGHQDDGSPMIGCDDCDAWYHWVCVGMQVPPADDEDWYCRFCIAKKQELLHDKKKKKRKKKVKVTA